jgi:hypothetical protein
MCTAKHVAYRSWADDGLLGNNGLTYGSLTIRKEIRLSVLAGAETRLES